MFVETAYSISQIFAERDGSNEAAEPLPPVLPHQLSKVDMRKLVKVIQRHRQQIIFLLENEDVNLLSQESTQLKRTSREEPHFNQALQDSAAKLLGFKECWVATSNRFPKLQQFCGGLSSAFPTTSTVKSDFSIVGWEKSVYLYSLTDFLLEGTLYCKQFDAARALQYHD